MGKINTSYVGNRDDVLPLIPEKTKKVLDVGCSTGILGVQIKNKIGAQVIGIEFDEVMANEAKKKIDQVVVGDLEDLDLKKYFKPKSFDCIIFADILEHLSDPWGTLARFTTILDNKGTIIISIPNVRHFSTIFSLVFSGYWPYRERGIHDKTHLRFFTLRNLKEMFQKAGLEITNIKTV